MTTKFSKTPSESIPLSFDFSSLFGSPSEYIESSVWTVTVIAGTDLTPNAILSGAPNNSYSISSSLVINGILGNSYLITCVATTNLSNMLTLYSIIDITASSPAQKVDSRQALADYALRQLGGGVINIEVTDEQIDDSIDSAIQYYHEYHFDGIERDYVVYRIRGTVITVADGSIFSLNGNVSSVDGNTTTSVSFINGNDLTTNKQKGYDKFTIGQTVKAPNGMTTTITNIVIGDTDNGYIPMTDEILGVKKILNITSVMGSSDYLFNVNYQIMMSEIQNLTSAGTSYFYGVQNYLGHLDFIMKKEKDFRFNRRMHKLYLDISWDTDVRANDIVAIEVYRALNPENFPSVYSDIWLRRYTTSLIKKIWGGNLRKYQGMQLPGGVTFNGQEIYNEAVQEIQSLEDEAIYSSTPLEFGVG